jgi:protein SCO1/2
MSLTACAKHYRADGMLLQSDAAKHTVVISHRDIEGYMPAMTMEFHTTHVPNLAPGTRISFQVLAGRRSTEVSNIVSRSAAAEFTAPKPIAIGTLVPDFTLTSETGRSVRLSSLRGKPVAIDFIYTRCPLPDVCPRLSANFARLQRRFGADLTLLSITIDPQFDQPGVLAQYARRWNANPESWHFLSGDEPAIRAVAANFGLLYFAEEGSITHTARTAVIDRGGRLAGLVEGSSYAVSQLGDLIHLSLESK